jgi:hypothetical protein
MPFAWKKIRRVLLVLVAVVVAGKLLIGGAIILLLTLVSLPDPHRKEVQAGPVHSTDLYVRNRTAAPLQLAFTVPRAALRTDTVWWGLQRSALEVGRALVLREVAVPGLHLAAPALVAGTADTLYYLSPTDRRMFDPWKNQEQWLARQQQPRPEFAQTVRLQPRWADDDSVTLTLAVAPDSAVLLVRREEVFYPDGAGGETVVTTYAVRLRPVVQWLDGRGRRHTQSAPLAAWLGLVALAKRPTQSHHLVRYVEYR